MKVIELIEVLQKLDQEAEVFFSEEGLSGADYAITTVTVSDFTGTVYLRSE